MEHAHHWLILHGRYVCTARKPDCEGCYLADICKKRAADLRAAAKDTPPAAKKPAAKA